MKPLLLMMLFVVGVGVSDARAERVSVATGKAVVAVGKATGTVAGKATVAAPKAAWRGIKWLAGHV